MRIERVGLVEVRLVVRMAVKELVWKRLLAVEWAGLFTAEPATAPAAAQLAGQSALHLPTMTTKYWPNSATFPPAARIQDSDKVMAVH